VSSIELDLKLASGWPWTTVINTLAVDSQIAFVNFRSKLDGKNSTAGDDSGNVYKNVKPEVVIKAYSEVFTVKNKFDTPHGLGLTLKYLRVGDLADLTPCSTEIFKCKKCGYKLVRMLDRFLKYTLVSQKAFSFNKTNQLREFKNIIAETEETWAKDLPIVQTILDTLKTNRDYTAFKNIEGKQKRRKETLISYDSVDVKLYKLFGSSYEYSIKLRDSKHCDDCKIGYEELLSKKYGLGLADIKQIENYWKDNYKRLHFEIPILEKAMQTAEEYLEKLNAPLVIDWKAETSRNVTLFDLTKDLLQWNGKEISLNNHGLNSRFLTLITCENYLRQYDLGRELNKSEVQDIVYEHLNEGTIEVPPTYRNAYEYEQISEKNALDLDKFESLMKEFYPKVKYELLNGIVIKIEWNEVEPVEEEEEEEENLSEISQIPYDPNFGKEEEDLEGLGEVEEIVKT
jgi:hypothetical protein